MNSIERIIRKHIKGSHPAKVASRKHARNVAFSPDYANHDRASIAREIAAGLSAFPESAAAWDAIADELERQVKERARYEAQNAAIIKAQQEGCPCCGRKIERNLSITGWWQCTQFGAVGFRAESDKPACNWQAFYVEL